MPPKTTGKKKKENTKSNTREQSASPQKPSSGNGEFASIDEATTKYRQLVDVMLKRLMTKGEDVTHFSAFLNGDTTYEELYNSEEEAKVKRSQPVPKQPDQQSKEAEQYKTRCTALIKFMKERLEDLGEDMANIQKYETDHTMSVEYLRTHMSSKAQRNENLIKRSITFQEENKRLQSETDDLKQAKQKLEQQQKSEEQELAKLKEENKKLHEELEEMKTKIENFEKKTTSDDPSSSSERLSAREKKRLKEQEADIQNLRTKLEEKKKEIANLIERLQELEKEAKSVHQERNIHEEFKEKEQEIAELTEKLERAEKRATSTHQESIANEDESKTVQKLQDENDKLQTRFKEKEQEIVELIEKLEKAEKQSTHQGRNEDESKTVQKLKDEIDKLRTRLSQIAGTKLTDNNPAIADLSDPNRPIALGEKFSELYDNEWTDAMDAINDIEDEKSAIEFLLKVVIDAYNFCQKQSERLLENVSGTKTGLLNKDELSKETKKMCKDLRKSLAVYAVVSLEEEFVKQQNKHTDKENVVKYMKKCAQVCWFMTVQDPMVVMDTSVPEELDGDVYKHYTRSGKNLDYLVWPVLYLHKTNGVFGPMLGKGVAQGKK